MTYEGKPFAVISKQDFNYVIQSLEDGRRLNVPIKECEPTTLQLVSQEERESEVPMEDPMPEPTPTQPSPTPTVSSSARDTWVRVTQTYIQQLDVQAEQLMAQIVLVEQQRDTLRSMLNQMTGRETPEPAVVTPKRTVLPPKRSPEKRQPITERDRQTVLEGLKAGKSIAQISRESNIQDYRGYAIQRVLVREGRLP